MGWEIPKSGGKTERPPVGNHLAILVGLFDMGRQWQEPFNPAKDKGYWQWRALFVWELCGEKQSGSDRNHVIAIDLSLTTGEKSKLRKWVEARTGKPISEPFDPTTELGQSCLLSVKENKSGYPVVDGMAAVIKGIPVPKPTYPLTSVTLEQFQAGAVIPEWVPYLFGSPLADHIRACQQIGGAKPKPRKRDDGPTGDSAPATSDADPIPF